MTPTEIRLQLLANGYTPIANVGKTTYLKGWPTLEVTPELVATWGRKHSRFKDTGLRVQDGLCVLDLDINDTIMEEVAGALEKAEPRLAQALVRFGKGYKEAWFFRVDEPFGRIATRRWLAPGADLDKDGSHVVEAFGGAAPRQFGAFGRHTPAAEGVAEITYEWADEVSPLTVPLADLPELTKADIFKVIDLVEALLEAAGWSPVVNTKKGESEADRVHDLVETMLFETNQGEVDLPFAALRERAGEEGLRVSASFIEPGRGHSLTRCLVGQGHNGDIFIWDSATGVTHYAADRAPAAEESRQLDVALVAERLKKLSELASEQKQRRLNKLSNEDDFAVTVAKLLRSYALCPSQQLQVVPIYADSAEEGMTLAAFRNQQVRRGFTEIGPKGGKTKVNPVDSWLSDRERLVEVAGLRMRPDMPRPLYWEGERQFVNTYAAPVHIAEPEGGEAFTALIEHLAPDPVERHWFLDWLAHKYQHPEVPGPGVVMVSRRQGAGRSTLFIILRQLFGSAYVRKVDGVTLTGDGGQSQYNTWLANSLLVQVDELFNAGTGAHLWQRKKAYDRIKGLIDPATRDVEIIQKTLNNYVTRTFTTFFMATNNPNALPLDEDDRRICVITNGDVMAEAPEVAALVNSVREGGEFKPGFITAVADLLGSRSLAGFDVYAPPPMFEGKKTMITLNMTDAGEAADEVLRELPGDYVTRKAFVERVRQKMGAAAADHKHIAQEAGERLDKAWVYINRTKIKDNGSKADVWARDKRAANLWQGIALADREAALAPCENTTLRLTAAQMAVLESGLKVVK